MHSANPVEVVLEFERLINSRNVDAIAGLLSEESAFIDSLGQSIQGVANLRSAWTGYFKMAPDYSISHSDIFSNGETVAMFVLRLPGLSRLPKIDDWKSLLQQVSTILAISGNCGNEEVSLSRYAGSGFQG
jgi:hypothetical protein